MRCSGGKAELEGTVLFCLDKVMHPHWMACIAGTLLTDFQLVDWHIKWMVVRPTDCSWAVQMATDRRRPKHVGPQKYAARGPAQA